MSTLPLDLLVVGAGPIGLATAAVALRHGAQRVLVVEQASSLRPVGGIIDLLPNSYRVLCALVPGISEHLQPFVSTPKPGKIQGADVTADGRILALHDMKQYGTLASLYWWQLQKAILESFPGNDVLVLNHQLVNIFHDDSEDVAVAEFIVDRQRQNPFKNWDKDDTDQPNAGDPVTSQTLSSFFEDVSPDASNDMPDSGSQVKRVRCRARIIVGADGINSVARRCIYRDTFPGWEQFADALFSGYVKAVAVGNPCVPAAEEEAITKLYFKNNVLSMLTHNEDSVSFESLRIMLWHGNSASFRWYINFSFIMDERSFKSASKEELRQAALKKLSEGGFSESLARISSEIWQSKDDEIIPDRAYYIIPATHPPPYEAISTGEKLSYPPNFHRPWHFGRVVLAGDSAHACPPFLAQGTAMGFEDVFELMSRLKEKGVWSEEHKSTNKDVLEDVFEKYQKARLDRVCLMQRGVMNRCEHDAESKLEMYEKLWRYDPGSI